MRLRGMRRWLVAVASLLLPVSLGVEDVVRGRGALQGFRRAPGAVAEIFASV